MVVAVDATGMPVVAKGVVVGRQERLSALADFVVERGSVSVEDVMDALGVSPATVRRDLDALAEQQLIIRTRGGASANPSTGEVPLRYRTARRPDEKAAIARRASALVSPGEVVGFNGGTTTTAAAHELGVRMAREPGFDDQPVTIVTNAVNIANDLTIRPQARVVCTGGEPLLQLDSALIDALKERGFLVAVETNGTLPAPDGLDWVCVSPKAGAKWVQRGGHELKVVWPQAFPLSELQTLPFDHFFLQPQDSPDPEIREHHLRATIQEVMANPLWRLSLQTHKLIGIP